MKLRLSLIPILLVLATVSSMTHAAGGSGGGGGRNSGNSDPDFNNAVSAIKASKFEQAIPLLQGYVARTPDDANGENWLAYAYRKSGQLEPAFEHYAKALKIDPNHLGAHEYVGEAYLMVGNLAKAEEHLKILDKLCFLPCEEYTDLKTAVAAYRANQGLSMAKP